MALQPNYFHFLGTLMYRDSICSPVYPAAWLLFGMAFSLAVAHFFSFTWSKIATVIFYLVPFIWVSMIIWDRRGIQLGIGRIDILFALFVFVVLMSSSAMPGGSVETTRKYIVYMPFMMVIPYLCGRLMCVPDLKQLLRITMVAGLVMLPLLLLDRFMSTAPNTGRWLFFNHNHGALLVGGLLAAALLALCVHVLGLRSQDTRNNRAALLVSIGLIGIVTVFLVWVMARGWLLAGLVAVAITCLSARHRLLTTRLGLLAAVLAIAGVTVAVLPRLNPVSGSFYAMLLSPPPPISTSAATVPVGANFPPGSFGSNPAPGFFGSNPAKVEPILGEASCKPLKEGINSVAIRWVLYREAMVMFIEHAYIGVGASLFGKYSCTGYGGFPHSTLLQSFAELGLMGGGLLAGLLALAAVTLARPLLYVRQSSNWSSDAFALTLFVTFAVADQLYGNYFMSVGTWLMLGVAASMRANNKRKCRSND